MKESELKFAVLATDIIVFRVCGGKLQVRLIDIAGSEYFKGMQAFPGGLLRQDETALEAATRVLKDKADISLGGSYIDQLHTYSRVDRDPRGRVVSVCHMAIINDNKDEGGGWVCVDKIKKLAYDHEEMLSDAVIKLKELMSTSNIVFKFLPSEVTYSEIKNIIEIVMEGEIDKRNFYKRMKEVDMLENTDKKKKEGEGRPAELYKIKSKKLAYIRLF